MSDEPKVYGGTVYSARLFNKVLTEDEIVREEQLAALRAANEVLEEAVRDAEKYNGWHQEACLENEKLYAAIIKASRYIALRSPNIAQEVLESVIFEMRERLNEEQSSPAPSTHGSRTAD